MAFRKVATPAVSTNAVMSGGVQYGGCNNNNCCSTPCHNPPEVYTKRALEYIYFSLDDAVSADAKVITVLKGKLENVDESFLLDAVNDGSGNVTFSFTFPPTCSNRIGYRIAIEYQASAGNLITKDFSSDGKDEKTIKLQISTNKSGTGIIRISG